MLRAIGGSSPAAQPVLRVPRQRRAWQDRDAPL